MVTADVEKSTSGLIDAFEDRDISTILLTGGLISVSSAIVTAIGAGALMALNVDLQNINRVHAAALGVFALAAGWGSVEYLPGELAGPLAVGATLVATSAAFSAVLGMDSVRNVGEETAVRLGLTAENVSDTVERAIPQSNTCRSCGTHAAPSGNVRSVSQDPAINNGYR